jgi:pre-mRNA-splicing factor 38A
MVVARYVTMLGAVYLRLVGRPQDVYELLEPLYSDYRKIRKRNVMGWEITHVDEVVDALLHEEFYIDLAFPRLTARDELEKSGSLLPRRSPLEEELDASDDDDDEDEDEDSDKEEGTR